MPHKIEQQFLQQYSHLELIAKQVVEGFITGLHKSPFHGFSVEFAEHRLYNTGESTRHIDWKLFARTEKFFVKRYEEETNLRCQLVIDSSSSMYFPEIKMDDREASNKIKFSVYAAAALCELFRKQRDAMGLSIFNERVNLHTPARSNRVHQHMLNRELEKLLGAKDREERVKTDAASCLHEIAQQLHKRSLVIIFSDMMETAAGEQEDRLFAALQHLRHNKHEVILFHTTERKQELDFEFENRPYHFVDTETGAEIKVHPKDVKDVYLEKIRAYNRELKLKCGQFGIEFVEAPVNEGFDQILLPYLIKRSKMI